MKAGTSHKWKVNDPESAASVLCEKKIFDEEGNVDCDALARTLLEVADAKSTNVTNGETLRAIGFTIRHMVLVDAKQADIVEATTRMGEEMKEMKEQSEERFKELQKTIEEMKNSSPPTQVIQGSQDTEFGKGSSYASVLRSAPMAASVAFDPTHNHAMHRMEMKERRVIISGQEQAARTQMAGLSEAELLARAKLALEGMDEEVTSTRPKNFAFKAVNKLMGGGASYEVDSSESASWLRRAEVKKRFMEKFGVTAEMREVGYPILARYVPISLGAELEDVPRALEEKNELETGDIARVKWMKDPRFWEEEQKYAFLVVVARSKEVANRILERGLKVEGRTAEAQILDEDPKRCFKCQAYTSHVATECPAGTPTCGLCGGKHDTKACTNKDQARCVNCVKACVQNPHHPAFSRACPCFIQEKKRIAEKRPEQGYKFYPTADPATWVRRKEQQGNAKGQVAMSYYQRDANTRGYHAPNQSTPFSQPRYTQTRLPGWKPREVDEGWAGMANAKKGREGNREEGEIPDIRELSPPSSTLPSPRHILTS